MIGPQLPPHLSAGQGDNTAIGPALPAPPKRAGPAMGPSLPSTAALRGPSDRSDDDDDDVGPMPLPSTFSGQSGNDNDGVRAFKEREDRDKERDELSKHPKQIQREEWMLAPPKELDMMASIDTTKLKSRGFRQTNKPHSAANERSGPSDLWTESPAERAQRLEDEVMGKRKRRENSGKELDEKELAESRKKSKRDKELRKKVAEHNKMSRGDTLADLHSQASASVESSKTAEERVKDKKEAVIWDREQMMGLGGKIMGEKERRDMMKDAKQLGGRFGKGSFL